MAIIIPFCGGMKWIIILTLFKGILCWEADENVFSESILESPIITNFGEWGDWEHCAQGSYASGMRLKVEANQGNHVDDSALNGIESTCLRPDELRLTGAQKIKSSVSVWGTWSRLRMCEDGVIIGFQLRSERFMGGGYSHGRWTGLWQLDCTPEMPTGKAVTAIQTQVEPPQGYGDDTALNNVRMMCTQLKQIAAECTPTDKLMDLLTCDNSCNGDSDLTCTYRQVQGVSIRHSNIASVRKSIKINHDVHTDISSSFLALRANFVSNYVKNVVDEETWASETSQAFRKSVTAEVNLHVPKRTRISLRQLVGTCGPFEVYSAEFYAIPEIGDQSLCST